MTKIEESAENYAKRFSPWLQSTLVEAFIKGAEEASKVKKAEEKDLDWLDLSYANGWERNGMEYRICELIHRLGYKVEVTSHSPRGTDTEYRCEDAKVKWHVDSSD